MNSKKRLVICMFTLLILATLMPLSAAADQPILKGPAQNVIDYIVYTEKGHSESGPWETIDDEPYYKTLVAPSGYHYIHYGNNVSYSSPQNISPGYWIRTHTVTYNYILIPD